MTLQYIFICPQIDYPEVQTARGVGNPRLPSAMERGGVNLVFDDSVSNNIIKNKNNIT